jgi:hypothetical protein
MLDLLSKSNSEVATFGNQSNITNIRIYDADDPANGYIITKQADLLALFKESGVTNVAIGDPSNVSSNANFFVDGTIITSNIGTYSPDGNIFMNGNNLSAVGNIYLTGNLIKNGDVVTNAPPKSQTPIRYSAIITAATQYIFNVTAAGAVETREDTMAVYINGVRIPYLSGEEGSYTLQRTYDGTSTQFTITMAYDLIEDDVIDITIWPGVDLFAVRQTVVIAESTDIIVFSIPGAVTVYAKDVEFFVNGVKYSYFDETDADFLMTTSYDGINTTFTFTLGGFLNIEDVVDITAWYSAIRQYVVHTTERAVFDYMSTFYISVPGIAAVATKSIEVFVSGQKLTYVNATITDYDTTYVFDGTDTIFTIEVYVPILEGNVVDITLWLGDGTGNVGLSSQWSGFSPIAYVGGAVGIGTTTPSDLLEVTGGVTAQHVSIVQPGASNLISAGYTDQLPSFIVATNCVYNRYNGILNVKSGVGNTTFATPGAATTQMRMSWVMSHEPTDADSFRVSAKFHATGSGLIGNKQVDILVNPSTTGPVTTNAYAYTYVNEYFVGVISHTFEKITANEAVLRFSWNSLAAPYNTLFSIEVDAPDVFTSFIVSTE